MKKEQIILTRKVLEVEVLENAGGGAHIFDVSTFKLGKAYKVFGTMFYRYEDGSGDVCWLIETEKGSVEPKVTSKFRVVKEE